MHRALGEQGEHRGADISPPCPAATLASVTVPAAESAGKPWAARKSGKSARWERRLRGTGPSDARVEVPA
ncbi:MAG TPA: hypothetical protein VG317_17815, partial [Pseudonocardiaceae bacterium]|nr:hypothetical protein [Pseudonocardiaceae bacterium]